jgi:hypothetical protein
MSEINKLANELGGYVVLPPSILYILRQGSAEASIVIRVPAERLDEADSDKEALLIFGRTVPGRM